MSYPASPESAPLRTAVITGAGSGIGLATARLLHKAGFRLFLVARDRAKLAAASAELWGALTHATDLANPGEAERTIATAHKQLGRIDALINNAGWTPLKPIGEHTEAEIDAVFRINAIAPCITIARAFPLMIEKGGGCIVNVSSMATADPFPGLFAYAAAKASVNLMVKSCANEGASKGIRAFSIAPGAVETPLLRGLFSREAIPQTRTLTPEAVATVIVDCVLGKRDTQSGSTIFLPSP